ncbi:MAG: type I 3-dehydroquinate dehydratase [Candidatus Hodarchaeota archaeon]
MMNKFPVAVAFQITIEKIESGEIKNLVGQVGKTRASYVEFRLDYENDVESIPLKDLLSLARDNELKSILTCRIKSEGGKFDGADRERHERILGAMVSSRPDLIDIELSNEKTLINDVLVRCMEKGMRMILSYHDFDATPKYKDFENFLKAYEEKLRKIPPISGAVKDSIVLKVIFRANALDDNFIPFKLINRLKEKYDCDVVSFCMGAEGISSRLFSVVPKGELLPRAGLFTFASFGEKTAPGQVHLNDLIAKIMPFLDDSD